ncbi:hypothetical protein ALC53_01410 [Atta colombica]|uniref:Retrotransposon gag domain-containing protein n=1 Tax=Atta colombica TaxID=520822 RepID=A0A195BVI6_9HYME|nr:hypothetical protein ALC53_01410 [Atta colombica]
MTVLHDWLLRYELDAPKNPVRSCFSSAEDLETRQLRFSIPVQTILTDYTAYSPTSCVVENGVHRALMRCEKVAPLRFRVSIYHIIYWFCNGRAEWRTWNEFVTAWRSCFNNFDFQFALYNEIIRRTQEEHESVADYLTCIQILDLHNATRYRAPLPPEKSLFPNLAYRSPKKNLRNPTDATRIVAGLSVPKSTERKKNRSRDQAGTAKTGPCTSSTNPIPTPVIVISTNQHSEVLELQKDRSYREEV